MENDKAIEGETPKALQGTVTLRLVSLAWPLVLANELGILGGAAILFWLGQFLGSTAIAAEGMWSPAGQALLWSFASVTTGSGLLMARSVGAADGQGWTIFAAGAGAIVLGWLVVAPISIVLSPTIASWLAGDSSAIDEQLIRLMIPWLLIVLPTAALGEYFLEGAHATGWTQLGIVRVVIEFLALAGLLPLLLVYTDFGIAGAALADGMAGIFLLFLLAQLLARRSKELGMGERAKLRDIVSLPLWGQMMAIGVPVTATRVAFSLVQLFLIDQVAADGASAVAGYSIAMLLLLFAGMATMGIAKANGIVTATALGAGQLRRAKESLLASFGMTLALSLAFCLLFVIAGSTLAGLFVDDPETIAHSQRALIYLTVAILGVGAWQVSMGAMAALGKAQSAGLVSLVGDGSAIIVVLVWPGDSVLIAACVAMTTASVLKAIVVGAMVLRTGLE